MYERFMFTLQAGVVLFFAMCTFSGLAVLYATYMNVRGAKALSRQEMINYIGGGLKLSGVANGLVMCWMLVLVGLHFTLWNPWLYGTAYVFVALLLIAAFVNNIVAASVFDNY